MGLSFFPPHEIYGFDPFLLFIYAGSLFFPLHVRDAKAIVYRCATPLGSRPILFFGGDRFLQRINKNTPQPDKSHPVPGLDFPPSGRRALPPAPFPSSLTSKTDAESILNVLGFFLAMIFMVLAEYLSFLLSQRTIPSHSGRTGNGLWYLPRRCRRNPLPPLAGAEEFSSEMQWRLVFFSEGKSALLSLTRSRIRSFFLFSPHCLRANATFFFPFSSDLDRAPLQGVARFSPAEETAHSPERYLMGLTAWTPTPPLVISKG